MVAEARIGVLIETDDPDVAAAVSPGASERDFDGAEQVAVFEAPSWTGRQATARIEQLCRAHGLDRVVIAGPSSGGGLVPEWIDGETDQARIPVICAPVREQCAGAEHDRDARAAKARRLLDMAVARARGTQPCAVADIAVERSVAVIGGNHAAFQMARILLEAGYPVVLLQTGSADGCFYPISRQLVEQVSTHGNVELIADARVEHVAGRIGDYRLRVGSAGGRTIRRVGALVVAVDAETCPLRISDAVAAPERVLSLREYGQVVAAGGLDEKAACIWLDRDGLDRRCAGQAALESALAHARRGGRATLLFRQIPLYGHGGQVLYDQARAAGVTAIRYDTAPHFSMDNGTVRVAVTDTAVPDGMLEFAADRLVVPALVRPPESHARLAALLRQPLDLQGYLQPGNVRHRPVASARRGVYFVGGCHDECDPEEAGLEARAVLADLMAQLPEGTVTVPVEKVVVDTDKCAACLTCYRACPHGAIEPNVSQHCMDVLDPACWQCGICVAVCPSRALEHGSLGFEQMHQVLAVATRPLQGRHPIIAFACRQSAVPAADAVGHAGLTLPTDVLLVDVPCAGLVGEQLVLEALALGARGVLVLGCHHDNCRSLWGTDLSRKRVDKVGAALGPIGVEAERVQYHTLAANEPHRLAHLLAEAAQQMPAERIGSAARQE